MYLSLANRLLELECHGWSLGRTARIQELANLMMKGELPVNEFQACVAEFLNYRLEPNTDEDWFNSMMTAPREKTAKRDNCTAVAEAIGVVGLAIIFLIIALVLAHQNSEIAFPGRETRTSTEYSNGPKRLPFWVPHNPQFAVRGTVFNGLTIAKENT